MTKKVMASRLVESAPQIFKNDGDETRRTPNAPAAAGPNARAPNV